MTDALDKLRGFRVEVARDDNGRFTVHSEVEPLFCFIRETEEEVKSAIQEVLTSYLKIFAGLNNVEIQLDSKPVVDIPVRRLTPVSTIRPHIEFACA